jgi:hypothetical protein
MKLQSLTFTAVILMLVVAGTFSASSRAADRSILCLIAPSASQNGQDDIRKQEAKKKNKDSTDVASEEFSESVAERLVQQLSQGLEDHNARRMLSAFDGDSMDGYVNFQNQIAALFDRYDSFRVHFHIVETSAEGTAGVALVDLEMEESPSSSDTPVRKNDQLRLEMKRGKKGWKIVDVKPRAFFS